MIDIAWARTFAREWAAAWNAGDLERVLAHYADDFEMTSPLIIELMGIPSGTLKGKAVIRPYWAKGLAAGPLHFEVLDVVAGIDSIAIYYHSVTRSRFVVERIGFNARGEAVRGEALYRSA